MNTHEVKPLPPVSEALGRHARKKGCQWTRALPGTCTKNYFTAWSWHPIGIFGLMIAGMVWMYFGSPPLIFAEEGSISVQREDQQVGDTRFTMEFRDADVKDVLRAIGQETQRNIIIAQEVEGSLTLSFRNVSLEEALRAILKVNNLMMLEEGSIIRVFNSPFTQGEENMVTRMIRINFADIKESQTTAEAFLTSQGSLSIDPRTNTLIVRDLPENVDRIREVLEALDTQTPQVLIEARIVEASRNFTRELGVQWGGRATTTANDGSFTVLGAGSGEPATPLDPLTEGVGPSGNNFAVNLPAGVGQNRGGALGFTFGSLSSKVQLDLQLSAMEDSGEGKILSNPRILTLNNRQAKISSGTEILIPVSTITTGIGTGASSGNASGQTTAGVTTIDAKLELVVTPHVTSEDLIVIHVRADKKEPDFNRAVQDIPPLTTRTAETDLLVRNGDTVVIGGIYTRNKAFSESRVPWLSKIPVLGWLFKKQNREDIQGELLIFITPTIKELQG